MESYTFSIETETTTLCVKGIETHMQQHLSQIKVIHFYQLPCEHPLLQNLYPAQHLLSEV